MSMTRIGTTRFASQVIHLRKMDLPASESPAYRSDMFKPAIGASIIVLSVLVALPACAPDLQVGSSSSEGGAGGMDASSSSGMTSSSSSGGGSSSSSSSASTSSSGSSSGGSSGKLGTACSLAAQCASGFCTDGVCCDAQCNAPCVSCNQSGMAGTCLSVPVATDDCSKAGELCDSNATCACGVSKPPVGTTCPAGWMQGPKPGICVWSCSGPNDCSNGKITCPDGFDCIVECSGPNSCSGIDAEVECPPDHNCSVSCTGSSSCQDGFRERCSDKGPCNLTCGADQSPCLGGEIRCGSNACLAICGGATKPKIDMGNSCGAQGC